MRIAQISPHYHPYVGGVEKVVQKISEEMVKRGHRVEVLTIDAQEKKILTSILNGVIIKRFSSSGPFHYSRALYNYLIENGNNYDIVHAHSFHTLLPLLCARAKEKAKQKFNLVLTGHYHGKGRTFFTTILLRMARFWFSGAYKQADLILCLTEFEKQLIISHFHINESKIRIIPNGVDIDEINSAKPFDRTAGRILLIVSRLEKYKNIHLAIRAMHYLPEDYRLVIIGDGSYRQQLQRLTSNLGLGGRVEFLGRLPNEELFRWYKTCDLVLNLSNLEAFGLTVIEGLAACKPVLVNNRTALSEMAQRFDGVTAVDACCLHPKALASSIKERIKKPFTSPDLEEYHWGAIAEKLLRYYILISSHMCSVKPAIYH